MPVVINGTTGLTGVAAIDSVSSTELGYVDGVTAPLQTQVDGKVSSTGLAWTSYTPTWTATGGTPAVGGAGGSLSGAYIKIGQLCHVNITCQLGASPTGLAGTTLWAFSLPFASVWALSGTAYYYDATGSAVAGFAVRDAGGATVYLMTGASAYVGASAPFTWAANDYLSINATYRVAA